MASSSSSLFEQSQISSEVTADGALQFFKEHGIFYQEIEAIGQLLDSIKPGDLSGAVQDKIKAVVSQDPRLCKVAEPFPNCRKEPYFLTPNNGAFYALTVKENQDTYATIFACGNGTEFDFFDKSHKSELEARPSNLLAQVPYVYLKETRGLEEFTARMKKGGIVITHPRNPISPVQCVLNGIVISN